MAVGAALGEAEHGGDRRSDQVARGQLEISKDDAHRFRQMFAHRDVIEPMPPQELQGAA